MADEARKRPGVAREYRDERIVVYWRPQFCIHTANCLNAAPDVFDAMRRPWIVLDAAEADDIAEAVMRCPTGRAELRAARWRRTGAGASGDDGAARS